MNAALLTTELLAITNNLLVFVADSAINYKMLSTQHLYWKTIFNVALLYENRQIKLFEIICKVKTRRQVKLFFLFI